MKLGIGDGNCRGTWIAGIVEKVAAGAYSDTMCFLFVGTDGWDKVGVSCFSSGWNHRLTDRKNGTGAFNLVFRLSVLANAVREETAELIGGPSYPNISVGPFEELCESGEFCCFFHGWHEVSSQVCNVIFIFVIKILRCDNGTGKTIA